MDKLIVNHKAKTLIVIVIIVITPGPPEVDERRSRLGAWRVRKGSVMPACTTGWCCTTSRTTSGAPRHPHLAGGGQHPCTHCWLTVSSLFLSLGPDVPRPQGRGDPLLQDMPTAGLPALPSETHAQRAQDHTSSQCLPGPQGEDPPCSHPLTPPPDCWLPPGWA